MGQDNLYYRLWNSEKQSYHFDRMIESLSLLKLLIQKNTEKIVDLTGLSLAMAEVKINLENIENGLRIKKLNDHNVEKKLNKINVILMEREGIKINE